MSPHAEAAGVGDLEQIDGGIHDVAGRDVALQYDAIERDPDFHAGPFPFLILVAFSLALPDTFTLGLDGVDLGFGEAPDSQRPFDPRNGGKGRLNVPPNLPNAGLGNGLPPVAFFK